MSGLSDCRLLIADDQSMIRDAIRRVLSSRNVELDIARDGEEALQQLDRRSDYAGAVLDHRMPGCCGLDVMQRVRAGQTQAPHGLPLVLITGHGDRAVVAVAGQLDIDAVLAKPFTTKTFLDRLECALAAPAQRKDADAYAAVTLPQAARAPAREGTLSPHVVLSGKPLWATAADVHRDAGNSRGGQPGTRLVPVDSLRDGMLLGQAITSANGRLLAGPGLELTARLIAKIRTLAEDDASYRFVEVFKTDATV